MRELVMLDWMVPERSWAIFRETVESEHGSIEGYLGRTAEAAMDEFAEADGYERVEDLVDRLVQAAGRTPDSRPKEKNILSGGGSDLADLPTERVTIQVDASVKERFKAAADESAFSSYGVAFGRALELYCDGGRADRLEDKLERVVDDAEALLSEMNESDGDGGLGKVDRNVITICNRLTEQFTDQELNSEIHAVAGNGPRASEPTLEKYRDLVTERLDVEPHPNNPDSVWVPADVAAEIVDDGVPEECRRPPEMLDRAERVRRIQLALGRQAASNSNGFARATTTDIHEQVFGEDLSRSSVLDLMNEAALDQPFELDKTSQTTAVQVELTGGAVDDDLKEAIIAYRDADDDGMLGTTTETTVSSWSSSSSWKQSGKVASVNFDTNERGASTDGGGPPRDRGDRDE